MRTRRRSAAEWEVTDAAGRWGLWPPRPGQVFRYAWQGAPAGASQATGPGHLAARRTRMGRSGCQPRLLQLERGTKHACGGSAPCGTRICRLAVSVRAWPTTGVGASRDLRWTERDSGYFRGFRTRRPSGGPDPRFLERRPSDGDARRLRGRSCHGTTGRTALSQRRSPRVRRAPLAALLLAVAIAPLVAAAGGSGWRNEAR